LGPRGAREPWCLCECVGVLVCRDVKMSSRSFGGVSASAKGYRPGSHMHADVTGDMHRMYLCP
jgi:hypothetical protein